MLNEVQGGRWDEALRRLFSIKEAKLAPTVAPEIVPVAVIQPHGPDLHYLKREYLAQGSCSPPAVAGNNAYAVLVMPAAARGLVVVTEVRLYSDDANQQEIYWGWDLTGAAGNPAFTGYRDARAGTTIANAVTLPTLFTGANVGFLFNQMGQVNIPIRGEAVLREPFVLGPNNDLMFAIGNVNVGFHMTISWTERSAEATEVGTR